VSVARRQVASRAREGVHPASDLPELIDGHQVVMFTAPLISRTRGLLDSEFLAAMDEDPCWSMQGAARCRHSRPGG
jgi:phosphoglycerate dehydrogenase-like enzyme